MPAPERSGDTSLLKPFGVELDRIEASGVFEPDHGRDRAIQKLGRLFAGKQQRVGLGAFAALRPRKPFRSCLESAVDEFGIGPPHATDGPRAVSRPDAVNT